MITFEAVLLPLLLDTINPVDPDGFDDAHIIYGGDSDAEAIDFLDTDNDCSDPGGHLFLHDRCKFCGRQ